MTVAGRFDRQHLLGAGGGGEVWLARDRARHAASVAIKLFALEREADALAEFRILSGVRHPVLPAASDVVRDADRIALVLEPMPGIRLSEAAAARPLDEHESLELVAALLMALDRLHGEGVVHLDVKPDNILVRRDARGLRVALIDAGQALSLASAGWSGRAGGTPRFAAPEVLAGARVDARADLYACGRSLREVATPQALRMHAGLFARLDDADPARRFGDADAALRDPVLAGVARRTAADLASCWRLPYVARVAVERDIARAFERRRPVSVRGVVGAGKSALLDHLARHARLRGESVVRLAGRSAGESIGSLATQLGVAPPPRQAQALPGADAVMEQVMAILRAAGRPTLILVDDAERIDPRLRDALLVMARGVGAADAGDPPRVVFAATAPLAAPGALEVALPTLAAEEVVGALRRVSAAVVPAGLPTQAAARLVALGKGVPQAIEALARVAARQVVGHAAMLEWLIAKPLRPTPRDEGRRALALDPAWRRLLELLAHHGVPLAESRLVVAAATPAAADEQIAGLRQAGLIQVDADGRVFVADRLAALLLRGADAALRRERSAALADALADARAPLELGALALHRFVAMPTPARAADLAGALQRLREQGRSRLALRLAARLAADDGTPRCVALAEEGRCLADLARFAAAERLLRRVIAEGDPAARTRAWLGLAECASRQGMLDETARLAAAALALAEQDGDAALLPQIAGLATWTDYLRGAYPAAIERADRALRQDIDPVARGLLHNVLGLCWMGLRRFDRAGIELDRALCCFEGEDVASGRLMVRHNLALLAQRRGEPIAAARILLRLRRDAERGWSVVRTALAANNLALIFRDHGRLHRARRFAEEAVRIREALDDRFGLASSLSNLATILIELAEAAAAILPLRRAQALFKQCGARRELATVRKNLARAALALRDFDGCARAERDVLRLAAARHLDQEEADVLLLRARRRLLGGEPAAGVADLASVVRLREAAGIDRGEADLELALAWPQLPASLREPIADALLARIERQLGASPPHVRERRGMLLLARGLIGGPARADEAGRDLEDAWRLLQRCERPRWRFVAAIAAAGVALQRGAEFALAAALAAARDDEARLTTGAPGAIDEVWRGRYTALCAALPHVDLAAFAGPRSTSAPRDSVIRVLDLYRDLALATDVEPLLDAILAAARALTGAARAFLMVKNEDETVVVRSRDERGRLDQPDDQFSHSILASALATGRRLVVGDAVVDPHWRENLSVKRLRLRSVVCLPLAARSVTLGALYLDNAGRSEAFAIEDLDLLERFADQASLALQRLRDETRIRALNRVLEQRLERVERELAAARHTGAVADRLRPLARLLGGSVAMARVRDALERAALTDLPVLLTGESGTGKGLAARCVHDASPRRAGPFVVLDGAAIPEALFEAEVFGVGAGAFSGAGRGRPGLFAEADGGTLFLDDVALLSSLCQSKLLRAIESGVVRPLGGDPRRIDVRIVAAAPAGLRQEVAEGRFREDLYFRLRGIEVELPPLRTRRADVPLLCERILGELSGKRQINIRPSARARLLSHDWPGNVRELENEMARLAAADVAQIAERDLSPAIRGDWTGAASVPVAMVDADRARQAVERTERESLVAALAQTGGNRSRAAILLGMSRFGLLKKMKRLGLS